MKKFKHILFILLTTAITWPVMALGYVWSFIVTGWVAGKFLGDRHGTDVTYTFEQWQKMRSTK